ncbi:hypothetical protein F5Y10DRAFT_246148 [Nemania abortiva]|nr:hypothetical protein F5Y10DRAFT_246148 [Nemania abortiva]
MPHATCSSTSTSSDLIPRSQSPVSYPRDLDISSTSTSGTSGSGASASTSDTSRPLMSYTISFDSNWQRDMGSPVAGQYQQRRTWSTQGNARSNP